MIQNETFKPVLCPSCGKPMRLAGKIPGIGGLPELWTFECRPCAQAITKSKAAVTEGLCEPELEKAE